MNGSYNPKKAQQKSYVRRRSARFQGKKVAMNKKLRDFVEEKLRDDISPAAISGRLKCQEGALPFASKDSIYRFLKSPYGRALEYEREQKTKHRRKRPKVLSKLSDRTFINERPNRIEMREDVGDIEGDFIVSGKTGKGSLLVAVDRKLRVSFLEKIFPVTIEEVHEAFCESKNVFQSFKA
ncbi:IS30 family transposase [Candidatus Peregrinibacteria bacterium]|nr:MAG: IS30 family transposase [Candidatus Peregrinibacteria bacterium]QQR54471.1 MAG: IS30 family transposase [Candidatus Peregrinibacteria bacterium]QQR54613.1 MAG: IS30 family transposase [Candidatus Peregrinibacteria bacterium]